MNTEIICLLVNMVLFLSIVITQETKINAIYAMKTGFKTYVFWSDTLIKYILASGVDPAHR